MAQTKYGDTVKVHYTGKLENGTVFDSSINREPLQLTIGEGRVIPGFENALVGMSPGESKTTKVETTLWQGKTLPLISSSWKSFNCFVYGNVLLGFYPIKQKL